jgi:hypothetical protein
MPLPALPSSASDANGCRQRELGEYCYGDDQRLCLKGKTYCSDTEIQDATTFIARHDLVN